MIDGLGSLDMRLVQRDQVGVSGDIHGESGLGFPGHSDGSMSDIAPDTMLVQ